MRIEESPKLKPWQIEGANWLATKRHALLADEPRVGKTLCALRAAKLIGARRILIVCPAVARRVWAVGVQDVFARPATVVTNGKELTGAQHRFDRCTVVTSYGLMPDSEAAPWDLVIFDECHFLKSTGASRAQRALGVHGLAHRAQTVWLLSGTPAPSHAGEMWTMLRTFGVYRGSYEEFLREFCTGYFGAYGWVVTGSKNQDRLRVLLKDFMLRRTLAEVAPDLLPIEFSDYPLDGVEVVLPPSEVLAVAACLNAADPAAALPAAEPALATLRRLTGVAKVPAAIELLRAELEAGTHKLVIFAVHTEVVAALALGLAEFWPVQIVGGTPAHAREASLWRFQNDIVSRVFIGNIQAAGTAIDLSVASECVFVELSFVPGDNHQAAMRLQNMNRTGTVTARFLSAGGTIDEKITRILCRKAKDLAGIFS